MRVHKSSHTFTNLLIRRIFTRPAHMSQSYAAWESQQMKYHDTIVDPWPKTKNLDNSLFTCPIDVICHVLPHLAHVTCNHELIFPMIETIDDEGVPDVIDHGGCIFIFGHRTVLNVPENPDQFLLSRKIHTSCVLNPLNELRPDTSAYIMGLSGRICLQGYKPQNAYN